MNRNKLKTYAPRARRDFIKAVTDRAAFHGLTEKKIEPVTQQGDVAVIAGKAFPRSVAAKRKQLEDRINRQGFDQVMEAMAYTWFNRFVAIRFMELHGYLDHGYRVLSPSPHRREGRGGGPPEILEHAEHLELPGLKKEEVVDLKLDGTKEAELYKMLLLAQCHALHKAMPFLFEAIDDETELLLPDNLLHSDSLIRKLVGEIPEEDWQEVEVIGWLYQFYISEKKDQVIGKVVKSEDIPAATQLFTPNWIVKYLVQNSLGRQWVATYPDSPLKAQMEYYIEPAEQTPEVQEQLKAITPDSLNPEELTLLDPACGSGHILVEAYDLLKAIYQERGYRAKDIPRLILEKNLFGLEIDDRAAQLAAFALMMKAREDDRRIFAAGVQPHVLAIQESKGLDAREITEALNQPIFKGEAPPPESLFEELDDEKTPLFAKKNLAEPGGIPQSDVAQLIQLFEHGKKFGSLIQVPEKLARKLPAVAQRIEDVLAHGGMFEQAVARSLYPLVEQARLMAGKYDAVVTNPPYMGSKYFIPQVKSFVAEKFAEAKNDLYGCFLSRNCRFAKSSGAIAMITIPNWMFLSGFELLRESVHAHQTIESLVHNGRGVWGSDFGSCSFVARNRHIHSFRGVYKRLFDVQGSVATNEELRQRFFERARHMACQDDFGSIPGAPIAYWVSDAVFDVFQSEKSLSDAAIPRQGLATGDNARFLRHWHEVSLASIGFGFASQDAAHQSGRTWFPCNKGGPFRKWYGNNEIVLRFDKSSRNVLKTKGNHLPSESFYFRGGITWSTITVSHFSMRLSPPGFLFETKGAMCFPQQEEDTEILLGYANSKIVARLLLALSPTVDFHEGPFGRLPFKCVKNAAEIRDLVKEAVSISKNDWNSAEVSWEFQRHPLLLADSPPNVLMDAWCEWKYTCESQRKRMQKLEEDNNRLFLHEYGLQDELSPEVPEDQITLHRPDREEDIKRLLSYATGCMMGRYSLDKSGLIYAHSGNEGFDSSQYNTFPADEDGIIPFTDTAWFDDDAANRMTQFIAVAWPEEHLQENLTFIAESLGPKKGESPRDTIRRYLSQGFFKHHMKMYKKRPIYWLFSSGKQRAFECLVYLHRYNEGTLGRMRTEYVIPLIGKMRFRMEQLAEDSKKPTSTAHGSKLQRELSRLRLQLAELAPLDSRYGDDADGKRRGATFDEKLRHYADQRIVLDLDDGVKVNYGKFGDLLAEVKAITGKKPET